MLRVRNMSLHGHKGIRRTLLAGSITLLLFVYGLVGVDVPFMNDSSGVVIAQGQNQDVRGYAWSDNIGWISFNCLDTASCGAVNYGVKLNGDDTLTGYAWSDNIGWIKFGGLSSFPSGPGTASQNAQLIGNSLFGWARACAGTINGNCSSMTDHPDGWDGWISFNGNNYQISLDDTDAFDGYAWGGDVVGWLDWQPFNNCSENPDDCIDNCPALNPGCVNGCPGVCVAVAFDYSVSVETGIDLGRGDSGSSLVSLARIAGSSEVVSLTAGDSVGLSNISLSKDSCSPDCTANLTFTVDNDASYGVHTILITAVSESGAERNATISVNVPQPVNEDDITCSANSSSAKTGQTVVWSVQVDNPELYTFEWRDSSGLIGTEQNTERVYNTEGLKGATVTVIGEGFSVDCSATISIRRNVIIEEI